MSILCISDIHLSESRPAVTELFFTFLKREARRADALYILGDLFDAWIGDDDCSQLANDVRSNLSALTDAGTKLFLQHGNRDFLIGQKFLSYIKASLLEDYHILEYGKLRLLLTHGDLLSSDAGQRHQGLVLKIAKKLLPRFLIKTFFKNFGLYMLIKARK